MHDGVVAGTGPASEVRYARRATRASAHGAPESLDWTSIFRPDPHIHDGQFANNGWLQELPKPHTRLTWDNAALISPATAERLGLSNEEVVELQYEGRKRGGTRLDSAGTARTTPSHCTSAMAGFAPDVSAWVQGSTPMLFEPQVLPGSVSACKLSKTGRRYQLGLHSAPSQHGRAQPGSGRNAGGVSTSIRSLFMRWVKRLPKSLSMYPRRKNRRQCLGHGD